jgi:hypothetical protein
MPSYMAVGPKGNIVTDEWTEVSPSGTLVKFTYSDLPTGEAFLTAQIAGHEVVCSVILPKPERPFSRERVESHFKRGTDVGLSPHAN